MSAGVLLVLAAPTVWILSGAPGAPARVFGAPVSESLPANEASTETPSSGPSPTDASPDAAGPVAAEDAAPAVPPPFTTTAPRGAIDRSRWPVDLAIPSLGVTAPVQPVGVGTAGELIIPPSPMDVGWYQGGSMPGEPGVALLTSHIDTRSEGRGVLSGLVRLSEGDEVLVTAGDGVVQRWSVVARTQHRKDELPSELFARAGTSVLALVTCGGPFDPAVRSYRDNVIVWAELAT
jgi:sortase (surface protein transpeptidase)